LGTRRLWYNETIRQ